MRRRRPSSAISSCQFCVGIHTDELLKGLGGTPGRETTPENDAEAAALDYAEQVTKDSNRVDDALFDRLKKHFDAEEIVELTFHISFMNCLNRFNNALQVVYEGGYPDKKKYSAA